MIKLIKGVYIVNPIEKSCYLSRKVIKNIVHKYKEMNVESLNSENYQYIVYGDLEDEGDYLFENIVEELSKKLDLHKGELMVNIDMKCHKTNYHSICYELLEFIQTASLYRFTQADFEAMEEFLATPRGKELEGWAKWEEYWKKREE